jgi:transglutaminase-like putative cysteine protease
VRYRIRHSTTYVYERPVFESFNEIRLQPMACASQTLLDFDLVIEPPATVISFRDYYDNAVHDFGVPYLHEHLSIHATSDVVTHAGEDEQLAGPRDGEPDASPSLGALRGDDGFADLWAEFLGPSVYIVLADASADLARELVEGDPDATALAYFRRAADVVRERLAYRVGATTVNSSVAEVLAGGSGVCQDFAHVVISLCRHAGLPARYVSGYLGNVADASASHAWAEAFVPPYGWVGIDATLGLLCTGRHVKVGVGRDYADVAVLRGTYHGGGEATLEVSVSSESLDGTADLGGLGGDGDSGRGRLVAFQNLGTLRQYQRRTIPLRPAVALLPPRAGIDDLPPPRAQPVGAEDVPTQQPRQQQQAVPCSCA